MANTTAVVYCEVEDDGVVCGQQAGRRSGYCKKHYKRWLKYGDPTIRYVIRDGPTECTYEQCERRAVAKGLCHRHWVQQRRGEPLRPAPGYLSPKERLMARRRIDESGCWLWTGHLSTDGYGRTRVAGINKGETSTVHRLAYELWVGPVGHESIHHKCAVRACFNPEHLELATHRANNLEMFQRRALVARIAELEARVVELEGKEIVTSVSTARHTESQR